MNNDDPSPPYIGCRACGESFHIDIALGEHQGRCENCSSFMRRPTAEEEQQFYDFMQWKFEQQEAA